MNRTQSEKLYKEIQTVLTERAFLKNMSMSHGDMLTFLEKHSMKQLIEQLLAERDERGRFSAVKTADMLADLLADLGPVPENGWPAHAYEYVLGQLFPEKKAEES